ncbi:MAG: hypothetical protein ACYTBZ_20720, partial [Planctomycetota bacterium]
MANNSAQLFIDDFLMESSSNLVRTLHQPRKDNQGLTPIIKAKPGTTLLAYGTIVYDPGLKSYVMFVQEFPSRQMYRLVSVDGLTWVSEAEDGFETVIFDRNLEL